MDDPEVLKNLHISWGLAVFSQQQELTLFKRALSWCYRNRLVSDWHYINHFHYCYYKKTNLCRHIAYGYRDVEYGSSKTWSGTTKIANILTALEPFLYLSVPLNSVPCSSENRPLPPLDTTDVWQDLLPGDTALHIIPGAEREMISSSYLVIFACSKSLNEQRRC